MGRERIVLGSTKIVTKGEHFVCSKNNISYSSLQKIQQVGRENGIVLGNSIEQLEFSNPLTELIQEAYWIDEKNEKTNLMGIKSNEIRLYIKFNSSAIGKGFSITIKSLDPISDDEISAKTDFVVEKENSFFSFDLSAKNFQKGGDAVQKLYFLIEIEGQGKMKYPASEDDYLKVHVIRYIPQVMRAQNTPWEIAAQCQEIWFEKEKAQKPNYSKIVTKVATMNWVKNFPRVIPILNDIKNKKWETENSINLFCKRLKEMISNNDTQLPKLLEIKHFGKFDNSQYRNNNKGVETTLLDRYHINEIVSSSSILNDPLDDLYGALGHFIFRITPKGTITYFGQSKYKISYQKIAVYFIDSFDFQDEQFEIISPSTYTSQPLGCWNFAENKISKSECYKEGFYYIDNASYQNYQNDYNQGGDYMLISDYEEIDVDFSFIVEQDFLGYFRKV